MLGGPSYWLGLVAGLCWALWAPKRWREAGLGLLAAAMVLRHSVAAGVVYLALGALVWSLVRSGGVRGGRARAAVCSLAGGLVLCESMESWTEGGWHTPLGLSYLVFRLIHVVVDAGRGAWTRPPDAWEFVHFLLSPALFVAGPLERWGHWEKEPAEPAGRRVSEGLWRVLAGLMKKLFIADWMLPLVAEKFGWATPETLAGQDGGFAVWQACLFVYLKIYAEFSGYSDIAVGVGLWWGRRPMENFNWPVIAATPADFWRRWHISIAQWCADCVYLPLMGRLRNVVVPMLASFVVMGLWHGLGWNRVGWAVWQVGGLLMLIAWQKRMGRPKAGSWRARWPWRIVSIAFTQAFVVASYAFMVHGETVPVGDSLVLIARMAGWSP